MTANGGFVKLWRKSLDSEVWKSPTLWRLWTWCLMKATYIERDQLVGRTMVHLMPGQFIFGRKRAAANNKMAESTVFRNIKKLEMLGNVNIKPNNKYSVITVVHWDDYQARWQEPRTTDDAVSEQQKPESEQQSEQQSEHNKEDKEYKKESREGESADAGVLQQACMYWKMTKRGRLSAIWRKHVGEAVDQGVTLEQVRRVFDRVRVDIKPWVLETELLNEMDGGKGDGSTAGTGKGGQGGKRSPRRYASADEQEREFYPGGKFAGR